MQPDDDQKHVDEYQQQPTEVKMAKRHLTKYYYFWLTTTFTVCIFVSQQIWSHFQKNDSKFIIEQNFINVFCDKVVCVPAVEIIGTQDCHAVHVLYFWPWLYTYNLIINVYLSVFRLCINVSSILYWWVNVCISHQLCPYFTDSGSCTLPQHICIDLILLPPALMSWIIRSPDKNGRFL